MSILSTPSFLKNDQGDLHLKRLLLVLVLAGTILTGGIYAASITQSSSTDLVAEYRFDQGAGKTAHDTAGTNDGTLNNFDWNASSGWTDGKFGKALDFDGVDDEVIVPDSDSLDSPSKTGEMTVEFWAKLGYVSGGASAQKPIHRPPYRFYIYNTNSNEGRLLWQIDIGGTTYNIRNYYASGIWDSWHHFVGVFDGEDGIIYLDGEEVDRENHPGTPDSFSQNLHISYGSYPVNGTIDDVRIYSKALNQSEIKSLYNRGAARFGQEPSEPSGKVLDIGFNAKNTTHVFDTSGNNNHGKPQNGASQVAAGCKVGRCYSFDGVDDNVEVPDSTSLDITSEITMMAWIKLNGATGDHQDVIRKNSAYILGWIDNDFNPMRGYIHQGGSWKSVDFSKSPSWFKGEWHHISMTYDGSKIQLYIDGGKDNSGSLSGSIDTTSTPLMIGDHSPGTTEEWNGSIDQVKIFNRALSQKEIIENTRKLDAEGAVLDMRFDSAGGDLAHDLSAHGNDGTLQPNETFGPTWTDGIQGKALDFDGTDDYVEVPHSTSLNITKSMTISAWVKLDTLNEHAPIVRKGGGAPNSYFLERQTDYLSWGYYDDTDSWVSLGVDKVSANGNWYFVTATRIRNGIDDNDLYLYVNGEQVGSKLNQNDVKVGDSGPVTLGIRGPGQTSRMLDGKIDEARIYPYALSESKIKQLYRQGASHVGKKTEDRQPNDPGRDGLVLQQNFDRVETCGNTDTLSCPTGMSGKVAVDESGQANHGELVNGPTEKSENCKVGRCMEFDGSSNYVEVSDDSTIDGGTGGLTLSGWIKTSSSTGYPRILSKAPTSQYRDTDGYQIDMAYGSIAAQLGNGSDNSAATLSGPFVNDSEWHQVALTWDGTDVKLFVDGSEEDSTTWSGDISNSYPFIMGAAANINNHFPGTIDQVRIYNRSLSKEEIWKLYAKGRDLSSKTEIAGPVGHWQFDAGQALWEENPDTVGNESNPGLSCKRIKDLRPNAGDGKYWIKPYGSKDSTAFKVQCDMTIDGGGWTLVGSIDDTDALRWADENFWMNETTFGSLTSYQSADYKSMAFSTVYGEDFMVSWDSGADKIYTSNRLLTKHWDGSSVSQVRARTLKEVYVDSEGMAGQNGGTLWQDPTQGQDQCYINTSQTTYVGNDSQAWENIAIRASNLKNKADAGMLGVTEGQYLCGNNDPDSGCVFGCWWTGDEDTEPITNEVVDDIGNGGDSTSSLNKYVSHVDLWVRGRVPWVSDVYSQNNGSIVGDPQWADGKIGNALDLDGSDDRVEIKDNSKFDFGASDDFSVSGWIKTSITQSPYRVIVDKGPNSGSSTKHWMVYRVGDDIGYSISDGSQKVETNTGDIDDGQWHHFTVVADRDGSVKLYIDSKEVLSEDMTAVDDTSNSYPVRIGGNDDWGRYFQGSIDDVRIYPYALTQEQVKQVYGSGAVRVGG